MLSPKQWLQGCNFQDSSCSSLAAVLSSNSPILRHLDLSGNFKLGDSGVKLLLQRCDLSDSSCSSLAAALRSSSSSLRHLHLSGNKQLGDSGVKLLSTGLEHPNCRLETLQLSDCGVTGEGYAALASALKSNPSHLEELDLRGNDPGDSGVELLTSALTNQKCKLRLLSDEAERACEYLTSVLGRNPLLLTELDLTGKRLGDSIVKLLCPLLKFSRIKEIGLVI
ncbi:NACHT, LRR and PYD domains-containing protein 12-like [Engraulis encrasicolus]|uniref:NACHT, LRR and PYD domains-containing protein 12-like n=1 Tax=Engraulis encrasicolus TaxID=184585 RepID=UPI002FD37AAE